MCHYFATLDYDVDEGVGPETFEDPEDFVEPGKHPFDHDEPFYIMMAFSLLH